MKVLIGVMIIGVTAGAKLPHALLTHVHLHILSTATQKANAAMQEHTGALLPMIFTVEVTSQHGAKILHAQHIHVLYLNHTTVYQKQTAKVQEHTGVQMITAGGAKLIHVQHAVPKKHGTAKQNQNAN